ncbi:hypothetical protein ACIQXI_04575 [Lysinibacillus sp. NPDC097195]|uniref:hypothetical protein n=1 Tax=Lysinibacillus sp. NPDC097195 TaxID=3364141 RepID=UPI00381AE191
MHKRLKKFFYLMIVVTLIVAIYIKNQSSSTAYLSESNIPQGGAEDIAQKLQSTQLTKKILLALRAEGYHPDSTIEYLIDTSDNQIIIIQLHNLDKLDSSTESKIQEIVRRIASKNNFNLFIVDVQLTDGN